MSKLEELQPGASVRGVLPDSMATVVSVKWYGSEALELTYKSASGTVANELVYRDDESRLEVIDQGLTASGVKSAARKRLGFEHQSATLSRWRSWDRSPSGVPVKQSRHE